MDRTVRYQPSHRGMQAAATSPEMEAALRDAAEKLAERANSPLKREGYFVQSARTTGGTRPRARAVVIAGTYEAQRHENEHHALNTAAGAGGL